MTRLFWIFLFGAAPLVAQLSHIELVEGGAISGQILVDRPGHIHVDLGFTVLSIPRQSVLRITEPETEDSPGVSTPHLYTQGSGLATMSVSDLVGEIGSTVVLVQTPTGLGSGFFIHRDGYVITNDHVIAGEHELRVTMFEDPDGDGRNLIRRQFENVRIVATSPEWDLALLKVEGDHPPFPVASLGSAGDLRQGQPVFAIGNPLGLERTVSEGIVSLRNRVISGRIHIQTTTEINPGNSGGPLFNLRGEVVGVNNMKVVGFGTEGLGFAIPAEVLRDFLRNRDVFAFDPLNPNSGFRYNTPPTAFPNEP